VRIHFTAVIEECRIAGDTSAIAVMLGKMNEELVDSIRPEIWRHLEPLITQRAIRFDTFHPYCISTVC